MYNLNPLNQHSFDQRDTFITEMKMRLYLQRRNFELRREIKNAEKSNKEVRKQNEELHQKIKMLERDNKRDGYYWDLELSYGSHRSGLYSPSSEPEPTKKHCQHCHVERQENVSTQDAKSQLDSSELIQQMFSQERNGMIATSEQTPQPEEQIEVMETNVSEEQLQIKQHAGYALKNLERHVITCVKTHPCLLEDKDYDLKNAFKSLLAYFKPNCATSWSVIRNTLQRYLNEAGNRNDSVRAVKLLRDMILNLLSDSKENEFNSWVEGSHMKLKTQERLKNNRVKLAKKFRKFFMNFLANL